MKNANNEMHVFHQGSTQAYAAFISQNRERIVRQDIASDRVLVWCLPEDTSDSQVFISAYFPNGET